MAYTRRRLLSSTVVIIIIIKNPADVLQTSHLHFMWKLMVHQILCVSDMMSSKVQKLARVQKEVKSDEGKEAVRAGEEQSSNIYLKERGLAGGIL